MLHTRVIAPHAICRLTVHPLWQFYSNINLFSCICLMKVECCKVEGLFYERVHALECEFAEKFKPLFEKVSYKRLWSLCDVMIWQGSIRLFNIWVVMNWFLNFLTGFLVAAKYYKWTSWTYWWGVSVAKWWRRWRQWRQRAKRGRGCDATLCKFTNLLVVNYSLEYFPSWIELLCSY